MKKEFNREKYEQIKNLLAENKITSAELDKYIRLKALRYGKHREENDLTDEAMVIAVNKGYDKFPLVDGHKFVESEEIIHDMTKEIEHE